MTALGNKSYFFEDAVYVFKEVIYIKPKGDAWDRVGLGRRGENERITRGACDGK